MDGKESWTLYQLGEMLIGEDVFISECSSSILGVEVYGYNLDREKGYSVSTIGSYTGAFF